MMYVVFMSKNIQLIEKTLDENFNKQHDILNLVSRFRVASSAAVVSNLVQGPHV